MDANREENGYYENQRFENIRLEGETLDNCRFVECEFINCRLTDCRLTHCSFVECQFRECVVTSLDTKYTVVKNASLTGCSLVGVHWGTMQPEYTYTIEKLS